MFRSWWRAILPHTPIIFFYRLFVCSVSKKNSISIYLNCIDSVQIEFRFNAKKKIVSIRRKKKWFVSRAPQTESRWGKKKKLNETTHTHEKKRAKMFLFVVIFRSHYQQLVDNSNGGRTKIGSRLHIRWIDYTKFRSQTLFLLKKKILRWILLDFLFDQPNLFRSWDEREQKFYSTTKNENEMKKKNSWMLKVFSLSLLGYTQSTYLYLCSEWLLCFSLTGHGVSVAQILLIPLTHFAILCLKCLNLHLTMLTICFIW